MAISIFSIVSLLSMGGLTNILSTQEHTEKNMQRLIKYQMAFTIISREVHQMSARPIRDEYGSMIDSVTSETSEGMNGLEFTHQGRFNLGDSLSLQRVAYYFENNQLVKKVWQVIDRVEDTKPVKQIILDDIDEAGFSFHSINLSDKEKNTITSGEISWQNEYKKENDTKLAAIKVSFKSKDYGELYRVFEVVQ
ncbi:MAG: type II secretion system minor pseudopilin GspJ [Gammaproteobacteria bacterium]|nr:type II secretion system minor pseudopilin GspJ [Gammaproteobacteria bacterium]